MTTWTCRECGRSLDDADRRAQGRLGRELCPDCQRAHDAIVLEITATAISGRRHRHSSWRHTVRRVLGRDER